MDNPERVIAAINALLSPFPAGVTQGPAEEVFRRYLEAVDEFTADDIDGGVDLLMKGKLPGYNGNFAPTPPQLASAARIVRDKRLDSEALTRRYTDTVGLAMRNTLKSLLLFAVVIGIGVHLIRTVPGSFVPDRKSVV